MANCFLVFVPWTTTSPSTVALDTIRAARYLTMNGKRRILGSFTHGSGEKVDVEGAIESSSRGRKTIVHTVIGAGAGALLGGIFGGGSGAGIGSVVGGAGGLGTTAFHGHQKITLSSGQEMLIRITRGGSL